MWKFEQGEIVRDNITGFEGVVMARCEYFTDCIHYGLCSQTLKDGKMLDWVWLDETRLIKVEDKQRIIAEQRTPTSGSYPSAPEM